jgi:hypothetical protein
LFQGVKGKKKRQLLQVLVNIMIKHRPCIAETPDTHFLLIIIVCPKFWGVYFLISIHGLRVDEVSAKN